MNEAAAPPRPWGEERPITSEAAVAAAAGEPQRTHPLSIVTGFIAALPQALYAIPALLVGGGKALPFLIFIIPTIIALSGFARWLTWRHFTYRIGEEEIRIDQGVVSRQSRSVPFERIQDVGLEQKLLPRLLGLAAVKIETGGGKGEDAELSYLKLADAEALRDLIRDRKQGVISETNAAAKATVEDEAPPLFAMDTRRLIIAGLFNFSLVVIGLTFAFLTQIQDFLPFDLYDTEFWMGVAGRVHIEEIRTIGLAAQIMAALGGVLILIAVGILSGIIRTVLRDYGFRLSRVPAGFRRQRGLLTLTDVVLPRHRVQAALILSGPIRRHFGWRELKFQSLAQDSKAGSDHSVAPLAHPQELEPILTEAGLENAADAARFHRAKLGPFLLNWSILALLIGGGATALLFIAPLAAPVAYAIAGWFLLLAWLRWRYHRHALVGGQLYVQTGWWRQRLTLLPMVKTQSIDLVRSPADRLFGTAGLVFGVAGGSASFPLHLRALPLADAAALRETIMAAVTRVDFSEVNEA
ncbi:PH domain-containing protein [Novosphingopyxis sp. YJ-S2-01]|uniref:PH domain-containing protein n=1 Tax=Novosphingopyxis sp. YJ-S2-01 TaxID=2794021 RepID=UPI0018DD7A4C|nr:PH domain-containing protein [Novosphingopyxis sp. YJ-S2-01]